ncbi:MAG: pitrilysin family protein [Candidatus Berkelbacteria bacterium]
MLNHQVTTLDNGLRVITAPVSGTKAVTILFIFGVGSRYEEAKVNGISHFLEHMFFKGTEKRPKTIDISRDLDSVGAGFNAYTGEEYTGYFVRVSSEHFELGLDVLTDMMFGSKFDAEELEREKGVIIEEINMYNDDPRDKVELVINELIYPNQPLGRSIAGEKEIIRGLTREQMVEYKNAHYTPENMVVAVAGGTDKIDWLSLVKEKFQDFTSGQKNKYLPAVENQLKPTLKINYKETDQAHFVLAWRSISRQDQDRYILKVLTNLMGQMMSSRLFIEVRERRGLCYYVHADMVDFQDTGFWAVKAGVDVNRIEEAVEVVLNEVKKLKSELISDEELNRAKENLKGHLYLSLEESLAVADYLAKGELLWGKIEDPEELVKKIEQVAKEDIQKLAQKLFVKESLNLAIVGPFKDEEKFKNVLNKY